MYRINTLLLLIIICISSNLHSQANLTFSGIKVKVTEIDSAIHFYSSILGFEIQETNQQKKSVTLKSTSNLFKLEEVRKKHKSINHEESRVGFGIRVNHLLPSIDNLRDQGVFFFEKSLSKNGVGIAINFLDPSGNRIYMMETQTGQETPFIEPVIYNAGYTVHDMELAEDFYTNKLGFKVLTRAYLPQALPLFNEDGSFAFMIHYMADVKQSTVSYPDESQTIILFSTADLNKTIELMEENNIQIVHKDLEEKFIAIRDPFGNVSEIYQD